MGKRVNMETKKTSLYQLHQDCNAKFVEFAGYHMPIQYSEGIVEEHKFTRNHSGIFDVSHMGQLFIYGDDELIGDLEKIFPLDLKNLKLNHSKYSFLMNKDAGIYDDLIISKIDEGFLIILNAACKDNDFKILKELLKEKYKMVLDENKSLIAIQGPKSSQILNEIVDGVKDLNFMSGKNPAKKPKKISCGEIIIVGESDKPMRHELIPATNCAGTISTDGNFLTIIIKTAKVIGIEKAAKFPDNSPGDNEFPTINNTPDIAKIIEIDVIKLIFSFKKKKPNIAKNKI